MEGRQLVLRALLPCLNGWGRTLPSCSLMPAGFCSSCSAILCTCWKRHHNSKHFHTSACTQLSTSQAANMANPQEASSFEMNPDQQLPVREHVFVSRRPKLYSPSSPAQASSMQPHREIFFPTMALQMMRLTEDQLKQIRETGWTREVAFRTAPHVTKLEIKAYLESVYGMKVERVSTINYLGRKFTAPASKVGKKRPPLTLREDDWKKAYVIFAPPPNIQLPQPPPQESPLDMLRMLRNIRRERMLGVPRSQGDDVTVPVQEPIKGASLRPPSRRVATFICTRTGALLNPHSALAAALSVAHEL